VLLCGLMPAVTGVCVGVVSYGGDDGTRLCHDR